MRYGVVGDVHGNLEALSAALDAVEAAGVDRVVCPGDVVGYGPHPEECIAMLYATEALVVAGNHDLMAIGELPVPFESPLVRQTIDWTRKQLGDRSRAWLRALPLELELDDRVLMTHGGLGDPTLYVHGATEAVAQLAELAARRPRSRGMLVGHTHHPLSCTAPGGRWLLNAGSVGQPRERRPVARALVFDSAAGPASAEFLELRYDDDHVRRELRAAGLPPYACHLAPGRLAHLRRRVASAFTGGSGP